MIGASGRQIPEVLHYVVWFNNQSDKFEPLAVFNKKAEAEAYSGDFVDLMQKADKKFKPIIMSWTWSEFCSFAQRTPKPKAES